MKKIITLAITAFLIGSPIAFANAQTVNVTGGIKTTINDTELAQVLTLLLGELSFLEQEYSQLAQAQASTTAEIGQIGTATSTSSSTATTSTLPQLETIIPSVTQTTTVTHNQSSTPVVAQSSPVASISTPAPMYDPCPNDGPGIYIHNYKDIECTLDGWQVFSLTPPTSTVSSTN